MRPKQNCLLLQLRNSTDLIVVQDFKVIRRTTVSGPFTLERGLFLPGFDITSFPFIVNSSKYGGENG